MPELEVVVVVDSAMALANARNGVIQNSGYPWVNLVGYHNHYY